MTLRPYQTFFYIIDISKIYNSIFVPKAKIPLFLKILNSCYNFLSGLYYFDWSDQFIFVFFVVFEKFYYIEKTSKFLI